jgi:hypothetical protein
MEAVGDHEDVDGILSDCVNVLPRSVLRYSPK